MQVSSWQLQRKKSSVQIPSRVCHVHFCRTAHPALPLSEDDRRCSCSGRLQLWWKKRGVRPLASVSKMLQWRTTLYLPRNSYAMALILTRWTEPVSRPLAAIFCHSCLIKPSCCPSLQRALEEFGAAWTFPVTVENIIKIKIKIFHMRECRKRNSRSTQLIFFANSYLLLTRIGNFRET